MELSFLDVELARSCNDDDARERRYGPALAAVLRRRLAEIDAAAHLAALTRLPAARLRPCPASPDLLLVSLGPEADLLLRPRADPPPRLANGRLDYSDVRSVLVTDVRTGPAAPGPRHAPLHTRREASR